MPWSSNHVRQINNNFPHELRWQTNAVSVCLVCKMKTHVYMCAYTCTYLHMHPYFNCGSPVILWAAHLRYSFLIGNFQKSGKTVELLCSQLTSQKGCVCGVANGSNWKPISKIRVSLNI